MHSCISNEIWFIIEFHFMWENTFIFIIALKRKSYMLENDEILMKKDAKTCFEMVLKI